MALLQWTVVGETYASGRYRLRHLEGGWRLEVATADHLLVSDHETRRSALERAEAMETVRIRTARVAGHAFVAVVALAVFVAILPQMHGIPRFLFAMLAFYLSVRAMANAVSVAFADAWGWPRDRGTPQPRTWTDRIVVLLAQRFRGRFPEPASTDRIQVLPPR